MAFLGLILIRHFNIKNPLRVSEEIPTFRCNSNNNLARELLGCSEKLIYNLNAANGANSLNMDSNKQHFRHIFLFYYRKGKNAVQARKKLIEVYEEDVYVSARTGLQNFDVEDAPRSGRPVEADKDTIKALVDANRRITTREIDERLNLLNSTVYDHLKGLGLTSKLDIWVPHDLAERNLCRRVDVCDSLLKRHENDPFLKRIITGDEKWVVYNNVKRKRSWSKKDEPAQSISKLDKLNDALQQKRPELINRKGVVFHQDSARPHTSLVSRQKLLQLE
ncbi:histone-lysine N-methyltransferase SETMAR-like [Vespa velutina]|uniref:histone-lysine N-methyltransferase SETMAR-like n=1 Tax=Vespa velutina TaxID=202808 RepID=UPI001FB55028|nr:histone-lysine N-methyltransferase SETMAR-like [Vespa velutina]